MAAHVYHWKHGWIPLDHTAALSKAKGNHEAAAKLMADAHSPHAGINTRQDVAKAALGVPSLPSEHRAEAMREVHAAAALHGVDVPGARKADRAEANIPFAGTTRGKKLDAEISRNVAAQRAEVRAQHDAGVAERQAGREARKLGPKATEADLTGAKRVVLFDPHTGKPERTAYNVVSVNASTITVTNGEQTFRVPHDRVYATDTGFKALPGGELNAQGQGDTKFRDTPAGIIATRGKRELHILGTSVNQTEAARRMLATNSFDSLFKKARKAPGMNNVAFIRL